MNTNELTIGLDLGDRRHHVCVLSGSGEIIAEEVLPNTRECLTAYAARSSLHQRGPLTPPLRVRMEA